MEAVVRGLVIPKVSFIGEIRELDGEHLFADVKRFDFYVDAEGATYKFDDDDKEKLNDIRQEIINAINSYYRNVNINFSNWNKEK